MDRHLGSRLPAWAVAAPLAVLYFVLARAALLLAQVNPSASAVWPATGLALAALLLGGRRLWPGIYVGAFAANLATTGNVGASLAIAAGNTLEAWVGSWLLERWAGGAKAFQSLRGATKFGAVVLLVATPLSATVGAAALWAGGLAPAADLGMVWLNWWLGDAVGGLVVAPVLILATRVGWHPAIRRHWLETALLVLGMAGVAYTSAFPRTPGTANDVSSLSAAARTTFQYLVLPILIWCTGRYGPRGTAWMLLAITGPGVYAALLGRGTYAAYAPAQRLVVLDISLVLVAILLFILAASVWERWEAKAALERMVRQRTASLAASETRFAAFMRNVPAAAWMKGLDGRYVWANGAFAASVRKAPAEIQGKLDADLFPAATAQAYRANDDAVVATGEPLNTTERQEVDGQLRTNLVAKFLVPPIEDSPAYVAGVAFDVTEREQADEARRVTQQTLEEAQAIAHIGSWEWDVPGNKVTWSAELCRIFGVDPDGFNGGYAEYLSFIHPDDRERVDAVVKTAYADHEPYTMDHRILRRDGTVRHIHSNGRVLLKDGQVARLTGTAQDVTERTAQESKFRGLLEAAPDAMVIAGQDGRITLVNSQVEALFGYRRDELLGQAVEILIPEGARGRHERHRAAYAKGAHARPMGAGLDLHGRRKDGSEFPVEVSLSPLQTPEGLLVISSVRDITDRKLAAQAVEASEARFRSLSEASPVGIFHTTAQGVLDYANARWREIAGAAEVTQEEAARRVHPEDKPALAAAWRKALAERVELVAEFRFVHPDGSVRFVATCAAPVRGHAGAVTGYVGTVEDVTEDRKREADLRAAKEEAERAAAAKSAFLANMSHEIRTPLNAVLGMAQILGQAGLDPKNRELVEVVRTSGEHLLTVLNDILDYSKMESDRLELTRGPVDARAVAADCIRIVAAQADAKGLDLRLEPTGEPAAFLGDASRLRQVLLNLLSNAIKFTDRGEVVLWLRTAPRGGHVAAGFAVRDTGIGIAPARLAHLFQPFRQLDSSATRAHGGTGLGLAISQRLVGLMGSRITVESEPGKGSVFAFSLDAERAALPAPAAAPTEPTPHNLAILLVEDNLVNQKVALRMMERLGYRADVAANGEEAVRAVRGRRYDVVLMDIQMPVLDGLAATQQIHRMLGPRSPFIVAMTAGALPGDRERCLAAGMDYYIAKPIRLEALSEVLSGREPT